MPSRAPKVCTRCSSGYSGLRCPTCTERRFARIALVKAAAPPSAYDSTEWREFSRAFLRQHPYCQCPAHRDLPVKARPWAQVVDHLDGLGPGGPRGYDADNCQSLTRSCHGVKTATFDGGFGNRKRQTSGTAADGPRPYPPGASGSPGSTR